MGILGWLDLFGVFVFAVSGALAADRKGMDLFGVCMIALMPAIGGGTVRDLILDAPVFWVQEPLPVLVALGAGVATFLLAPRLTSRLRLLVWADAFGLSLFAVLGAQKALALTGSPLIAIMMGVTTGVVGGMIRDVVCNELPLVLSREIYATAAFAGAGAYCLLAWLDVPAAPSLWASIAVAFAVRAAGLIWGLTLPKSRRADPP